MSGTPPTEREADEHLPPPPPGAPARLPEPPADPAGEPSAEPSVPPPAGSPAPPPPPLTAAPGTIPIPGTPPPAPAGTAPPADQRPEIARQPVDLFAEPTPRTDPDPSVDPRPPTAPEPPAATPTEPPTPTTTTVTPPAEPVEPASTAHSSLAARSHTDPSLPEAGSNRRPAVVPPSRRASGGPARYRSDAARERSIRRRANPLSRRIARVVILACVLVVVGGGLYIGARAFEDWWNRDQLPALGADTPAIGTSSFVVNAESPAPELDGRLTVDATTGAFEFIGRDDGRDEGWHLISPDGDRVVVRRGDEPWREAEPEDLVAAHATRAVTYLRNSDDADRLLTNIVRRHVELVQQTTDVTTSGEWTRYDLLIDTLAFSRENVLEWTEFRRDAIPGAAELSALPVTIWIDDDGVLVRMVDDTSGWRWERLAYLAEPFQPDDPTG